MKKLSFRSIVLLTLIVIVGSISFSAFSLFNYYHRQLIIAESEMNFEVERSISTTIELLKDQLYFSINGNEEHSIQSNMQSMGQRENVLNSFLFNADGLLVYSLNNDSIPIDSFFTNELSRSSEEVTIKSFSTADQPFWRASFHLDNTPKCYDCHSISEEILGYMVIDIAMEETEESISFVYKATLLFTLAMIVVLLISILFIHYKFVRKSLNEFRLTIVEINKGNFKERLTIPETKELGLLGKEFNNMLDHFQLTQKELKEYHKKELYNNYKMATIGEMSSRLAHEIRNPITGIANAIEIIVKETNDEENIPILEEIQRQAKRVNHTISDLLSYARKKELNLKNNDIKEVIKPLVFFLESQLNNKEIRFELFLQEDIPPFSFDHDLMENVLINLGLNAIQAIESKGVIIFSTCLDKNGKRVYIGVNDSGKGIPKENISKLFHPFFTTRAEGTGLGLAIVKDIIEKHDGLIWVENNKNKGCTFNISLPFGMA